MREVRVIGTGQSRFGRFPGQSVKQMAAAAIREAVADAGLELGDIEAAWFGNAAQGALEGQHSVRGQVILNHMRVGRIAVTNVENACASSSTAFHGAWTAVAMGLYDVALVVGVEKMYFEDKAKGFKVFDGGTDVEALSALRASLTEAQRPQSSAGQGDERAPGGQHSIFMDIYAHLALAHMERYGTTQRQLAIISSKNHCQSSLNLLAQHRTALSVAEVLAARKIAYPLTRPMCSSIGDGAAALVIASKEKALELGRPCVGVAASVLGSGLAADHAQSLCRYLAQQAYAMAGVEPGDVDVAEVHDASAFGELAVTEELGFCEVGMGGPWAEAGHSRLGGSLPVNPSGGLEGHGHPVGATGARQLVEVTRQLLQRAGTRQVPGARVGLTQNGGGYLDGEEAAMCIHILTR